MKDYLAFATGTVLSIVLVIFPGIDGGKKSVLMIIVLSFGIVISVVVSCYQVYQKFKRLEGENKQLKSENEQLKSENIQIKCSNKQLMKGVKHEGEKVDVYKNGIIKLQYMIQFLSLTEDKKIDKQKVCVQIEKINDTVHKEIEMIKTK